MNAYWQVHPRAQQQSEKESHTSKENDRGAKKASTPVTVYPLCDSAQQQEHERLATKLATTDGTTLIVQQHQ